MPVFDERSAERTGYCVLHGLVNEIGGRCVWHDCFSTALTSGVCELHEGVVRDLVENWGGPRARAERRALVHITNVAHANAEYKAKALLRLAKLMDKGFTEEAAIVHVLMERR